MCSVGRGDARGVIDPAMIRGVAWSLTEEDVDNGTGHRHAVGRAHVGRAAPWACCPASGPAAAPPAANETGLTGRGLVDKKGGVEGAHLKEARREETRGGLSYFLVVKSAPQLLPVKVGKVPSNGSRGI